MPRVLVIIASVLLSCFRAEPLERPPVTEKTRPVPKREPLTLNVRGRILILDLHGSVVSDAISDALRQIVPSHLVVDSGKRQNSWYVAGRIGCDAGPDGDGECMSRWGAAFKADWVLWGYLTDSSSDVSVEAQLVQTSHPVNHRYVTFKFNRDDDPVVTARRIWDQLVELEPN